MEEEIQALVSLVILDGQHTKGAEVFLLTRTKGKETLTEFPWDYTWNAEPNWKVNLTSLTLSPLTLSCFLPLKTVIIYTFSSADLVKL